MGTENPTPGSAGRGGTVLCAHTSLGPKAPQIHFRRTFSFSGGSETAGATPSTTERESRGSLVDAKRLRGGRSGHQ